MNKVYKIGNIKTWTLANFWTDKDRRAGFIHLCRFHQLPNILIKQPEDRVVLVILDVYKIDNLKWMGKENPRVYGDISPVALLWAKVYVKHDLIIKIKAFQT